MLQSEIHCMSPWQLKILDSNYRWNSTVSIASQVPDQVKNCKHTLSSSSSSSSSSCFLPSSPSPHHFTFDSPPPVDLLQQDMVSECHCLQLSSSSPQSMLGTYNLTWKRCVCVCMYSNILHNYNQLFRSGKGSCHDSAAISMSVPLPQVLVRQLPFVVSAGRYDNYDGLVHCV